MSSHGLGGGGALSVMSAGVSGGRQRGLARARGQTTPGACAGGARSYTGVLGSMAASGAPVSLGGGASGGVHPGVGATIGAHGSAPAGAAVGPTIMAAAPTAAAPRMIIRLDHMVAPFGVARRCAVSKFTALYTLDVRRAQSAGLA